jgi:hypothetical protein
MQVAQIPAEDIAPVASAVPAAGNSAAPPLQTTPIAPSIDLYKLQLDVTWGGIYLQHDARFVTLRAQNADIGQATRLPNPALARGRQ